MMCCIDWAGAIVYSRFVHPRSGSVRLLHVDASLCTASECTAGQTIHFSLMASIHPGAVQVTLFDVQQRTAIADLTVPFIKYIVWSSDMNHVALLSKHAIIVANKRLGQAFTGALHWNSSFAGVHLRCA